MRKLSIVVALLAATLVGPAAVWAGSQNQGGDGATVTTLGPSEMIRQAGYTLTDAEAAYLDADQPIGQQYSTALLQLVALGGPNAGLPDSAAQPALVAVLQPVLALAPAPPPEAPASLQPLRALAVEQRAATRRAAVA